MDPDILRVKYVNKYELIKNATRFGSSLTNPNLIPFSTLFLRTKVPQLLFHFLHPTKSWFIGWQSILKTILENRLSGSDRMTKIKLIRNLGIKTPRRQRKMVCITPPPRQQQQQ
jgi:hypothetical protein